MGPYATDVRRPLRSAYGVSAGAWWDAVASFAEACTIIRRLWTEDVFDFTGQHYQLKGARCNPKPSQRPHPPILIGGGTARLRIVAEHAAIWNMPGPPHNSVEHLGQRSRVLDEQCAAVGRDPEEITRSAQRPLSYQDSARTGDLLEQLIDAGFSHLVLNLPAPYPDDVARWVVDELITPTLDRASHAPRL